jgi:hypothetical protein
MLGTSQIDCRKKDSPISALNKRTYLVIFCIIFKFTFFDLNCDIPQPTEHLHDPQLPQSFWTTNNSHDEQFLMKSGSQCGAKPRKLKTAENDIIHAASL